VNRGFCQKSQVVGYGDVYGFCLCPTMVRMSLYYRFSVPAQAAALRREEGPHWDRFEGIMDYIADKVGFVQVMSREQWVNSLEPRQKRIYGNLLKRGFRPNKPIRVGEFKDCSWNVVKPFVKWEKYSLHEKEDRVPRPIQPRSLEYRMEVGRRIKAGFHQLAQVVLPGQLWPFMAKGMAKRKLAQLYVSKWKRFASPVALSLDMSKFDSTISARVKSAENRVFRRYDKDRDYQKLLDVQENQHYIVSIDGNREVVEQARQSGDPQTGDGNSIVMAAAVESVFDFPHESFCNGDDSDFIFEERHLDSALAAISNLEKFGFSVKVENVARDLSEVRWCQMELIETPEGWRWYRRLERVLTTVSWLDVNKDSEEIHHGVVLAEYASNPGMPILWAFVVKAMAKGGKYKMIEGESRRRWLAEGAKGWNDLRPPSEQIRQEYSRRYGIDPARQREIEETIIFEKLGESQPGKWHSRVFHPASGGSWQGPASVGVKRATGLFSHRVR